MAPGADPTESYDVSTPDTGTTLKIEDLPLHQLKLAGRILLGIAAIASGFFIWFALCPDNKALEAIFELLKIGVLPLATLVVSFYFTKD